MYGYGKVTETRHTITLTEAQYAQMIRAVVWYEKYLFDNPTDGYTAFDLTKVITAPTTVEEVEVQR